MKIKLTNILLSILLVFISIDQTALAQTTSSDTGIENAILYHINIHRQKHGLSKLSMDQRIVREARQHSQDMANHRMGFGHDKFFTRVKHMRAQINNAGAAAENVAYNYKSAEDVVKNWLLSRGHRQNINGDYNLTGIGIARDKNGKIYFTQLFLNTKVKQAATTSIAHYRRRSPSTLFGVRFY